MHQTIQSGAVTALSVAVLMLSVATGVTHAQVSAASPCEAIWALAELGDTRTAVVEACRTLGRGDAQDKERNRATAMIRETLRTHGVSDRTLAASLMAGLAPLDEQPRLPYLQTLSRISSDSTRACAQIRKAVLYGLRSDHPDDAARWLREYMYLGTGRSCLASLGSKEPFPSEDVMLLFVGDPAVGDGGVKVVYQQQPGTTQPLYFAASKAKLELSDGDGGPRTVYMASVPRGGFVTASFESPSKGHVLLWQGTTERDRTWDISDMALSCLRLQLETDPKDLVVLDGRVLAPEGSSGPLMQHLESGVEHSLVVLGEPGPQGARAAKLRTSVAAMAGTGVCEARRYDLADTDKVGVVAIRVSPHCAEQGLDTIKLKKRVAEFLGDRAVGLEDVGDVAVGLTELVERLVQLRGGDGPRDQQPGLDEQVRQVAHRVWSDRVRRLVMFDLQCGNGGRAADYAALWRLIELGDENKGQVRTDFTMLGSASELRSGLTSGLQRLLGNPYIVFKGGLSDVDFEREVMIPVEAYPGRDSGVLEGEAGADAPRAQVEARYLGSPDDPRVKDLCERLARANELRGGNVPMPTSGPTSVWTGPAIEATPDDAHSRVFVEGEPRRAGVYRMAPRLQGLPPSEERCLEVRRQRLEVYLVGALSGTELVRPLQEATGEEYRTGVLLSGIGFKQGVSGVLGFAANRREGPVMGGGTYSYLERSLLVGADVSDQWQPACELFGFCSAFMRRFGIVLRGMALANLVFEDAELLSSRSGSVRPELAAAVQVGLRLRLGSRETLEVINVQLLAPHVTDAIERIGGQRDYRINNDQDRLEQLRFNPMVALTIGVGLSYEL
jgi:hypothetical protein